jgi:hypothetical protein
MHIWYHSKEIPNKYGVNFEFPKSLGLHIFKTNYIPSSGRVLNLVLMTKENSEKFY